MCKDRRLVGDMAPALLANWIVIPSIAAFDILISA
jgi:hypothetical protein